MDGREDIIPLLIEAAPGFNSKWEEWLEYWGDDDRGVFLDCGEFARYIVASYKANDTSEFPEVFDTIERIIREGDDDARGVAIVGVLESIGNNASHQPFGEEVFVKWLGPLSHEAWEWIDMLYAKGGGSLTGVLRYHQSRDSES